MKEICDKLNRINEAWTDFILNNEICHSKIRFDEEVRTNYLNEIYHYLNDTIPFLDNPEYFDDFQKSIFQATGILQIIYAQQDLIDEFLSVFLLKKSKGENKLINKNIRNELIGHPIKKYKKVGSDKEELISSIFYGNGFTNGRISYLRYSKGNNYIPELIGYSLNEIIVRHFAYLDKYLELIYVKIKEVVLFYLNNLLDFYNGSLQSAEISVEEKLDLIGYYFTVVYKYSRFSKDELKKFHNERKLKCRYEYVINTFLEDLHETIPNEIVRLQNFLKIEKTPVVSRSNPYNNGAKPGSVPFYKRPIGMNGKDLRYEYSKLVEKKRFHFEVTYFREIFIKDKTVFDELNNMEENIDSHEEFYSSVEYLGRLLKDRGLL